MKRHEPIHALDAQYMCSFRRDPEGGYHVRCKAFPGLITFGETLEEARCNAKEALELCVEAYQEEGWSLPASDVEPRHRFREIIPIKLRA